MCFSLFDLAPSVFSSRFLGLLGGMTALAKKYTNGRRSEFECFQFLMESNNTL